MCGASCCLVPWAGLGCGGSERGTCEVIPGVHRKKTKQEAHWLMTRSSVDLYFYTNFMSNLD